MWDSASHQELLRGGRPDWTTQRFLLHRLLVSFFLSFSFFQPPPLHRAFVDRGVIKIWAVVKQRPAPYKWREYWPEKKSDSQLLCRGGGQDECGWMRDGREWERLGGQQSEPQAWREGSEVAEGWSGGGWEGRGTTGSEGGLRAVSRTSSTLFSLRKAGQVRAFMCFCADLACF